MVATNAIHLDYSERGEHNVCPKVTVFSLADAKAALRALKQETSEGSTVIVR